jgi:hypothetical protein
MRGYARIFLYSLIFQATVWPVGFKKPNKRKEKHRFQPLLGQIQVRSGLPPPPIQSPDDSNKVH